MNLDVVKLDEQRPVPSVLLVANAEPGHMGGYLATAAQTLGFDFRLADVRDAYRGNWLQRKLNWRLRGRRPARLSQYSKTIVRMAEDTRPTALVATGFAPLTAKSLRQISNLGVSTSIFLSDDPWNPKQRCRFIWPALLEYDAVFTPRTANQKQLERFGCKRVFYLPFGYDPATHRPDSSAEEVEASLTSDVLFVGGGDADRAELLRPLLDVNLHAAIYGGYWQRFPQYAKVWRGLGTMETVRRATFAAKVSVCLVRRSNRDGHVMRTFEAAATGGCLLVERTDEHLAIFGPEGHCVMYFSNSAELSAKCRAILADDSLQARLRAAVRTKIVDGSNAYADRLREMVDRSQTKGLLSK